MRLFLLLLVVLVVGEVGLVTNFPVPSREARLC